MPPGPTALFNSTLDSLSQTASTSTTYSLGIGVNAFLIALRVD
jgi:hypothetical protein